VGTIYILETEDRRFIKIGYTMRMLWETGRRWSYGMDTWAAKIEAALETKGRQIAGLAGRIDVPDGTLASSCYASLLSFGDVLR
jgi:hypothetical protein